MSVYLPLFFLFVSLSFNASAYHEKTEPSDGTVRSFISTKAYIIVPTINFLNGKGENVSLEKFKGKVILLNIWATWCGPCIRELPSLDRLQAKFNENDFVVLAISIDKEGKDITMPYYQKLNLKHLGIYNDATKNLGSFFPLDVVPATFVIDKNGAAVSFLRSFVDWDDPEAAEMVNYYLSQNGNKTLAWQPRFTH